ncbi:hypothetical protein [Azospirillum sp. TSH64]|uniref:hypothetical protein n=1 Tax=Azospirillum sp. TSH64 TaxID=652740 RepID=UPI000D60BB1A|nr:hypothetical protein [Azospirillum sp. TSH64]PWC81266.1 hypothetical protein TSH64_01085 [Azospirillum sp. TSH64]
MLRFEIKLGPRDLRKIDNLGRQAPYAIARALTKTAQDAQGRVRDSLTSNFTIRGKYVPNGIRYRPAGKKNLEAQVGSVSPFMELQETGGEREGNSAIPIGARRKITDTTRPGKWPSALLRKRGYFLAPIETGSEEFVIWQRFGRKRRVQGGPYSGQKRQPIRLMYQFDAGVEVKPRLGLLDTTELVVRERFSENFQWAYEQALATAR